MIKMMEIEDFGKTLFTILANQLIHEENPDSSEEILHISGVGSDFLEKDPGSYLDTDISCSVLMISHELEERFQRELSIPEKAKLNPTTYVYLLTKILVGKYTPSKFLFLCSFLSLIFHSLSSRIASKKKHYYVQQATEALKNAFQGIFVKDFPQNGWTDIHNVASEIAKRPHFLESLINNDQFSQFDRSQIIKNFEYQQTGGASSQERASANIPSIPNPQVGGFTPLTEVPILSSDVLQTNQTVYPSHSKNPKYILPVLPISYDKPQLPNSSRRSGSQTKTVTFQNQASGTESQKVVETADPSIIESDTQVNLTGKCSESEFEPLTETYAQVERDLYLSSSESEDESRPSIQAAEKTEHLDRESSVSSEEESTDGKKQFMEKWCKLYSKIELVGDKIHCKEETLSEKNNSEFGTFSKKRVNDPENEKIPKEIIRNNLVSDIPSKEEYGNDPERKKFSKEENIDLIREIFSKENVIDNEREKFSKENINDANSEAFSKDKNTLASGNAVDDVATNEAISLQKNNAQQEIEIVINLPKGVKCNYAKVLHLNISGKKYTLRMPADMFLIFKYNC